MKKLIIAIVLIITIFVGCNSTTQISSSTVPASSQAKQTDTPFTIQYTTFSEETNTILQCFKDAFFYDVKLNDSATYFHITKWEYLDGKWQEEQIINGSKEDLKTETLAIEVTDSFYRINIVHDKNAKAITGKVKSDVSDCKFGVQPTLNSESQTFKLDEQILLAGQLAISEKNEKYKTSKNGPYWGIQDYSNFQNIECDSGIVFTLTVN